jgi:DNA replication protein DnaC
MEELKSDLLSMKLSGMAASLQTLYETRKLHELSLNDGLQLLVQAEKDQRWSNRYARLIKNANFRYDASIEQLNTSQARGIDAGLVNTLAVGNYIRNGEAIIATGCSGCGKSFLISALGHQACRQGYAVVYYNVQKLMTHLKVARLDGSLLKIMERLAKVDLLILDDFGLTPLDHNQQNDFMEIIEDRHARKSTIIASQLPVSAWFDVFAEAVVADAVLDRIVHTAHRFELKGESLRKKR